MEVLLIYEVLIVFIVLFYHTTYSILTNRYVFHRIMRFKTIMNNSDNSVSTPIITADLQHLTEIQKVLSSVENAEEMLGYVNKIENFLAETSGRRMEGFWGFNPPLK
jgi:hypothetical protein